MNPVERSRCVACSFEIDLATLGVPGAQRSGQTRSAVPAATGAPAWPEAQPRGPKPMPGDPTPLPPSQLGGYPGSGAPSDAVPVFYGRGTNIPPGYGVTQKGGMPVWGIVLLVLLLLAGGAFGLIAFGVIGARTGDGFEEVTPVDDLSTTTTTPVPAAGGVTINSPAGVTVVFPQDPFRFDGALASMIPPDDTNDVLRKPSEMYVLTFGPDGAVTVGASTTLPDMVNFELALDNATQAFVVFTVMAQDLPDGAQNLSAASLFAMMGGDGTIPALATPYAGSGVDREELSMGGAEGTALVVVRNASVVAFAFYTGPDQVAGEAFIDSVTVPG